jgi:hypothetical protein
MVSTDPNSYNGHRPGAQDHVPFNDAFQLPDVPISCSAFIVSFWIDVICCQFPGVSFYKAGELRHTKNVICQGT